MIVAATGLLIPVDSNASVTFTFQDPSSEMEFQYVEGDDKADGGIQYATPFGDDVLKLTIDASEHGLAPVVFDAFLEISLVVGQATDLGFGTIASVNGFFRFIEAQPDELLGDASLILEGNIVDGSFFVVGTTGAQVSSSADNSLVLEAGPVLQEYLDIGSLSLAEQMDSSFSLSGIDLTGGGDGAPSINEFGYLESFDSNAAYVGTADIVPSPPAALLLTAFMAPASRRRRRGS
jgi:hypothetical protein